MARRKRITLPTDFDAFLARASFDEAVAMFDRCEVDATRGRGGTTALASEHCGADLAVWLLDQGATLDHRDSYGRTPFHHRCSTRFADAAVLLRLGADLESRDHEGWTPLHTVTGRHNVERVRELLRLGADITAETHAGHTPLMVLLRNAANAMLERTVVMAEILVEAGETIADDMRAEVSRLGRDFEFHRDGYNPDFLDDAQSALTELYRLFDVTPAPRRRRALDSSEPITVTSSDWRGRHDELWQLLVPSRGAAPTVQGEVIRISGRLGHELLDNGGINWRREHRAMLTALLAHLRTEVGLPTAISDELERSVVGLGTDRVDAEVVALLSAAAVEWVMANPSPIRLSVSA